MNVPNALHWLRAMAAVVILLGASCGGAPAPPGDEIITMVKGSYRTVADGRAEIVIGEFGDRWNEELGKTVEVVDVEVICGEESRIVETSKHRLTEPVCRVQLELLEIMTWSPPKARIRVVWENE